MGLIVGLADTRDEMGQRQERAGQGMAEHGRAIEQSTRDKKRKLFK